MRSKRLEALQIGNKCSAYFYCSISTALETVVVKKEPKKLLLRALAYDCLFLSV